MQKIKTNWNLTILGKADQNPQFLKDRKKVKAAISHFTLKWRKRQDYLKDPKILKQALDEYEILNRTTGTDGKEGYYFWLRSQQDQLNPKVRARLNQISDFSQNLKNELQFFELRISKIPVNIQGKLLTHPLLKEYNHFLERLFSEGKHLLTEDQEKIMNLKSNCAYSNWVKMTSSFLSKDQLEIEIEDRSKKTVTLPELLNLQSSQNKKVRDNAAVLFNQILEKYLDVAENELNSIFDNKKIDDDLRSFKRPDAARHLSDDIDTKTVDTLTAAVSSRFDIAQKYYTLKSKLLKVPKLEYHERNVEFGKIEKKYSWEESVNLVSKTFQDLDPEFYNIFNSLLANGAFDVFPKVGKRGGAFCSYWRLNLPTYILLNHTDRLQDVLTLAHEMGHAINDELIKKTQNSLNFSTPLSTAEVASTFMEDFVLQKILENSDKELRLSLMMMKLNDDISTIFRQIACYSFEQELHNQFRKIGYLSKEDIGKIFNKHMSSYMGKSVEQSKGSENWWVYWSHIRSFFYVYSYANGLLISKSLQRKVKIDPKFISKVKVFLSTGSSESPKNIFKKLGININDKKFWMLGLKEIENLLKETEKLAKELGKI